MPGPSRWIRVEGREREALVGELNGQLRYPLPADTGVRRTRVSCYPAHTFLHLEVPGPLGIRDSYAFHAPDQLYPLDWTPGVLARFNEVGLDIGSFEQACEAVRFTLWASVVQEGPWRGQRAGVVDRWEDLPLQEGATVDPDTRTAVEAILRPPEPLPPEEGDRPGSFRLACTLVAMNEVLRTVMTVGRFGLRMESAVAGPQVLPLRPWSSGSHRGVVLVREVAFTAHRFLRHLESGRPLHQARVVEPVTARGRAFSSPVALSQVTFEYAVDFGGAVFAGGLELDRCVFHGELDLREARVEGRLDARGIRFAPPPGSPPRGNVVELQGEGLTVSGSLLLQGMRGQGTVSFVHADIGGDLRLEGAEIGPPRSPSSEAVSHSSLNLSAARIGGDLDFTWMRWGDLRSPDSDPGPVEARIPGFRNAVTVLRGGLTARRMEVGGDVRLGGLRCEGDLDLQDSTIGGGLLGDAVGRDRRLVVLGDLHLYGTRITGAVVLGGMWVGGDLGFGNSSVGSSVWVRTDRTAGGVRIRPATVVGGVILSGIQVGDLEFEGSDLGSVTMFTGTAGRFLLKAGVEEEGEGSATVRPCRVHNLWMSDVTVGLGIEFVGLHVGRPREGGGREGAQGTEEALEEGFLRMFNVRCGGEVQMAQMEAPNFSDPPAAADWDGGSPPHPTAHRTRVAGDLHIHGLRAEGGLSLVNLAVGGRLILRNSVVEGTLDAGPLELDDGEGSVSCAELNLKLTRCGGDADLSGLRVAGRGPRSSIQARRFVVEGQLLFSRPRGEWTDVDEIPMDPELRHDAEIEGRLDLSVAEASHLVLSGSSFQSQDTRVGLSLERGRFRRLHIIEPWPFRHDLSDVKVERWQIPTEHLLTFLDRSHPFRRSTYIEIERILRNEAQDAEADRVYRGMRRRAIVEAEAARREEREREDRNRTSRIGGALGHLFRTHGSRLLGWAYGWGTLYWLPMLVVALPTLLFSWGLFSQPQNVEATPVALVARGIQARSGVQPPELGIGWGAADGLWMALRYHVPVVPLGARGIWEPSSGPASLRLGDQTVPLPLSGEGYAFLIFLLHWIIWPLFLYGLGRKVIRDRV